MERIIKITAGLILVTFVTSGQEQDYKVGFKTISTYDSGRIYKHNSISTDKLHYRPIDIDIWYPADVVPSDTVVSFVDLVYLLEQRSNFYDDTGNYIGLTDEMLRYICAGLNCSDHNVLKKLKTNSHVNAKPVEIQFPLIIYLAGLNGMSYENYLLFESLAREGFVVAAVSSIGRYPGNMTMEPEDVFEQIKDARFIIDYLTEKNPEPNIGLIGYSWGGLAASILAMTESDQIKAVVSLDGSEQFTYTEEEENEKLTLIREAEVFNPNAIKSSFLYLDSDIYELESLPDSIYNITDFIPGDKCYLKIDHAVHEDFSSLSVVLGENQDKARYYVIQQLTVNYLLDKFKEEAVFYENIPDDGITKQFIGPSATVVTEATGERILKGLITDENSNLPLPYVNIGIVNDDIGTASDINGEFELPLMESNLSDSLRISLVGYSPRTICVKDIFGKQKLYLTIQLQEKTNELNEIVISGKKLNARVLGNKTNSKFFGGKFASGDLGSEIAIRIKIKNTPTYLDTFSFYISYNAGDTATFRVNIYDIKNGLPGKNLLGESILLEIKGQSGKIDVDLSKYNVVVHDDAFIALEWVEGERNSGIVFSAGFVNKGTYYRKASQGRWRKYAMGVGFNVTARY